jgi:NADH:ubiquinone oxidoreductase subunit E
MSAEAAEKQPEARVEITAEQWEKVDHIIAEYVGKSGSLIPVLQQSQEVCGFLPAEVQRRIAEGLNISPSQVYGVVSFYSFFTMKPRGKYNIRVCLGTACFVKRGEEIYKRMQQELGIHEGEVTPDMKFSLEGVRCIGCCGLAPAMMVGDDTYGLLEPATALDAIKKNY